MKLLCIGIGGMIATFWLGAWANELTKGTWMEEPSAVTSCLMVIVFIVVAAKPIVDHTNQ